MKILIIVPKYNFFKGIDYSYAFPFGLAYISSTLKNSGHQVNCLNLNLLYGRIGELMNKALDKERYDIVCSGGYSLLYEELKIITDTIHEHKTKPIVILGGPIITSEPEVMFKSLKPDFAVIDEGEKTIVELLKCLKKKGNLKKVNGIVYQDKGKIVITNKREPIENIESIPLPDFESFGFEEQLEHMHCNDSINYQIFDYPRAYSLLGSRGCPFNCTFCWHPEKFRARSIDDIMKEINLVVKRYRINLLVIQDDCFSFDKKRLYEFCDRIKKLSEELPWDLKWTCQLLVNNVDEEMLKTMKDAGCHIISYGLESFSPKILKSMRKPITPQQIDNAIHKTWEAGIGITANFIFGDVAETKQTAKVTLDYWKKKCKGQFKLSFIQPYPGSDIYKHCLKKGIIKDKLDYIKNHMDTHAHINMTDNMTDKEFEELREEILNAYSRYVKFVRPISLKKMKKSIYEIKVKCPFCKEIILYKNCLIKNKLTYGFDLMCRKCHMRFYIVSLIQKIAYKHHSKVRTLRSYQLRIIKRLKKMKVFSFTNF